jgi:hypothetical protein
MDYTSASDVVLIWHHDGYKVACRACDGGFFHVRVGRELEDTIACTRRYTSGQCFLCDVQMPVMSQVMVEVAGRVLSRLFACCKEHLDILVGRLRGIRVERCSGWCRRCNVLYPGDGSHSRYRRRWPVLHVRRLYQTEPSVWSWERFWGWESGDVRLAVEDTRY